MQSFCSMNDSFDISIVYCLSLRSLLLRFGNVKKIIRYIFGHKKAPVFRGLLGSGGFSATSFQHGVLNSATSLARLAASPTDFTSTSSTSSQIHKVIS